LSEVDFQSAPSTTKAADHRCGPIRFQSRGHLSQSEPSRRPDQFIRERTRPLPQPGIVHNRIHRGKPGIR
jgi:hypothetical protein